MAPDGPAILAVFAAYLAGMFWIGLRFYRETEDMADYFLGARKLNVWVASLSAQASDMSGWLLLGLPGAAYAAGLSAGWIALGLAIGTYLNWRFVARRLRDYTETAGDAITLSDYLENRFRDRARGLRVVSAVFILIFFLLYTASGFVAGGKLFSTVFGVDYSFALAVSVIVVVSYTFLGGFNAVCWTDLFQGLLMLCAVVIVPLAAARGLGGAGATWAQLRAIDPALLRPFGVLREQGIFAGGLALVSAMAWGLGYFGQPHILARFMAIEAPHQIPAARRIAMTWVLVSLTAAVFVGLVGRAYVPGLEAAQEQETVFIQLVTALFPSVVAGVLLAAILAAIMSTADSQLLVTTSALTEDLYKGLLRPGAGEFELVWLSRCTVAGVALAAAFLARAPDSSVLDIVAYAWAGFGAAFGPVVVLSLYWRRMTAFGAMAGIVAGGLTVLVWKQQHGGLFDLYEIVPGCCAAAAAIVAGSLLSAPPGEAIRAEFDSVREMSLF